MLFIANVFFFLFRSVFVSCVYFLSPSLVSYHSIVELISRSSQMIIKRIKKGNHLHTRAIESCLYYLIVCFFYCLSVCVSLLSISRWKDHRCIFQFSSLSSLSLTVYVVDTESSWKQIKILQSIPLGLPLVLDEKLWRLSSRPCLSSKYE